MVKTPKEFLCADVTQQCRTLTAAISVGDSGKDQSATPCTANVSTVVRECEPLLTTDQTARLLQIHPKTLQRMAREREIPGLKVGDLWRFRASDMDEWVRDQIDSESPLVP